MPADGVVAFAPGRVNLIGEHTDYNEGLALPFAIAEGVTVRGRALTERRIEADAADLGESDTVSLDGAVPGALGWRAFVHGVVAELRRSGVALHGARLQISGTVPRGSGLSSSAALEVALSLALLAVADAPAPDGREMARLCSRVENEWVGAHTGLLDQLASVFGQADSALCIDFRSLDIETVPLRLGDWRLVILDSGERHAHAESGYNQRRAECAAACEALGIASLREATPDQAASLPVPLAQRARHVIEENERVRAAVAALRGDDLPVLGRLLDASHASLRDLYEVSTPAVEAAVDRLRDAGAAGARIVGGGFGGHVLGLVPPEGGTPAEAREVVPGPGARVLFADS